MKNGNLIPVAEFCKNHSITFSFMNSLQEFGLIKIIIIENDQFISIKELPKLKQIVLFDKKLKVNLEDVEVIIGLLDQVQQIQNEMKILNRKFDLYKD